MTRDGLTLSGYAHRSSTVVVGFLAGMRKRSTIVDLNDGVGKCRKRGDQLLEKKGVPSRQKAYVGSSVDSSSTSIVGILVSRLTAGGVACSSKAGRSTSPYYCTLRATSTTVFHIAIDILTSTRVEVEVESVLA